MVQQGACSVQQQRSGAAPPHHTTAPELSDAMLCPSDRPSSRLRGDRCTLLLLLRLQVASLSARLAGRPKSAAVHSAESPS